jgi:hypothetical protein
MKRYWYLLLIVIPLVAALVFYLLTPRQLATQTTTATPRQNQPIPDTNNGSTGLGGLFENDPSTELPQDPSATSEPASSAVAKQEDERLIREQIILNNDWQNPETVTVRIMEQIGNYYAGSIGFTDQPGGGLFYAVKQDGKMIVVFEGNGVPTCDKAKQYNIPKSMIPQCFDVASDQMLVR